MTTYLLQHLLADSAQRTPDAEAAVFGDDVLTYAELESRSAMVACALADLGVSPGDLVALHVRKSVHALVAIYGILKCGAAYVPIDFGNPAARIADVLDQCATTCIVTESAALRKLDEEPVAKTQLRAAVLVDDVVDDRSRLTLRTFTDILATADTREPTARTTDSSLAYVLFTSGSTGRPKGVMHTHRSALTFVHWAYDTFGIRKDDRLSNHAPFNFDLSIFDLFVAGAAGAAVCMVPEGLAAFPPRLAEFVQSQRITVWYSVPSVLAQLARRGALVQRNLDALRLVLFAGEVFAIKDLRLLMSALPQPRYFNLYGPTETNVCTYHEVETAPAANDPPLPIGIACENTEIVALAEDGTRIKGPGREGLLYVRGSIVMAGYLGRSAETEAAFVDSPYDLARRDRFYCSGDWVSVDDAGRYRFIGRRDHMVKVGGYRIELGEVEAALNSHPDVVEAVAIALPDELLGSRIRAVVVGSAELNESSLRSFCMRSLPKYMTPAEVEFRAELPRTGNDKVDRPRLVVEATGGVDTVTA